MRKKLTAILLMLSTSNLTYPAVAEDAPPSQAAQPSAAALAFGAVEAISDISLSPDGSQIAFIAPQQGQASTLFVVSTAGGEQVPQRVLHANGDPLQLGYCVWANDSRLICQTHGRERVDRTLFSFSSMITLDSSGGDVRLLSRRRGMADMGIDGRGGSLIDMLSDDPQHVLMTRSYVPSANATAGVVGQSEGLGVDRVDVTTARAERVVGPTRQAEGYVSDGNGNVRIMVVSETSNSGYDSGVYRSFVRPVGGSGWTPLARYESRSGDGFLPQVVDPVTNRAIGFQEIDGRAAIVAMALDGSGATEVLFSHPEVDMSSILLAGNRRRVVGATFVTERRQAIIADGALRRMTDALSRALNGQRIIIADESADGSAFLIFATSDVNPGTYYLYRPATRQLNPLFRVRPPLAEVTLAPQQPISYPAADGTMIPGYLTLPPGRTDIRGLPAIVMPHGGPSARDEWGFDWLAQFFAGQGFAVIQPNFRGSAGYGDQWYVNNGFQSWRTSVGDVTDAGRWLVSQGADPAKLSIVGWSYGGYAALQSGVIAPDLFRSIVAIAPVTDLAMFKREALAYTSGRLTRDFVGSGAHVHDGSPAQNVARISAPVLMFHGDQDLNVPITQSRAMRDQLRSASRPVELVEYAGLDHGLHSSASRTDMLTRIAAFLPH